MLRSDKEKVVEQLAAKLREAQALIVADYRGLTMPEIDGLRGELLQHGARFTVVKNTLTRRAAEEAGADALLALLDGPTAIAFLEADGDPVAVAKAMTRVARETKVLAVRGGVLEGRSITPADVEELSRLPAQDVLRAQVLGAIASPLTTIVGLFTAPLQDLVGLLDARIAQLGDSADAESPRDEAATEPEPAVEGPTSDSQEDDDDTTRAQPEAAVEDEEE